MAGTNFYEKVYEVVRQVPYGRVTSYGAIAEFLGSRSSARVVGYAMGHAGSAMPPVPAHRVLNAAGMLSGKQAFASPTLMQELLESEGIQIENDQVKDFRKLFWDPRNM